jgi:two-component sensor histidine kinase
MEEHPGYKVAGVNRLRENCSTIVLNVVRSWVLLTMLAITPMVTASEVRYASISEIHSHPHAEAARVTVQATLTLNGSPSYIQDATGGAELDSASIQGFRIGDELLVTGRVEDRETGLEFKDSRVELLWHGSPIPPLSVTPEDAALGKFPALLIEVNGRFVSLERLKGETWLRLESGHQGFLARLETAGNRSLIPPIEKGSLLRLRGVCSLLPQDTQYQGGFGILLRSAEDVAVITGPPWWNLKHLIELGILLAVLAIAGHVSLVQVLKSRFRAIMAERARLGHELHDTLAQSFAGLSYQIQAARKAVPRTDNVLSRHLDVALDMVRHSHAEAHRSIMMLRPQELAEGANLPSAIQRALEESTVGCNLDTRFTINGSAGELPLMATDALYRIAQEAIANALRHGQPTAIEVALDYKPASVALTVIDNGRGFDTKASNSRGFGLAGIRERARALRGHCGLISEPGHGTRVHVEIPRRREVGVRFLMALSRLPSSYWNRVQDLLHNGKAGSS